MLLLNLLYPLNKQNKTRVCASCIYCFGHVYPCAQSKIVLQYSLYINFIFQFSLLQNRARSVKNHYYQCSVDKAATVQQPPHFITLHFAKADSRKKHSTRKKKKESRSNPIHHAYSVHYHGTAIRKEPPTPRMADNYSLSLSSQHAPAPAQAH